ncbi:DUF6493 family protein [Hymenobacter negativus]|uniref:Uncharacterized protein n=1 Tax=Hymenobacter negativus TaxID=2795026 RepID=A0ABS3QKB2_9BACT|nr:DUF6493 family protein [Hymenobacter negativus]MBO2011125.1 hypothetical protein [Hymenobacter negativus]
MLTSVETFEQIVRQQGLLELVNFLLQLPKADVVPVRLRTKQLYREMNDWRMDRAQQFPREREPQLFLAGLATFSKQEALGRNFNFPWNFNYDNGKDQRGHKELFTQVLLHSRPAWFTSWLQRVTRGNSWEVIDYAQLRELAAADLVEYDPWLFAQSLAHRLNRYNRNHEGHSKDFEAHILRQLRADTVMLERDVPLLFDFDTAADSAAIYQSKTNNTIAWIALLRELVASGHLDRADILTRCLLALRRDFRRPLLTWFKNLFLELKPTVAERLARQAELVELLAHPLPLVINFALDQFKDLWAEADFAPAPLLLYAESLTTRQDLKTGLRNLLSAFEKLLKRAPELAPTVARLAGSALANADAAVQERAAKLLASLLNAKKPLLTAEEAAETTDTIGLYADLLASAARTVLTPFLAASTAIADQLENAPAGYAPLAEFRPEVSPATAIAPVQDWHELLFLTGQVLQNDNPAAFERWLDGLLRLRSQFPADYPELLMPYLKQAFQWELQDKPANQIALILANYQFGNSRNGHRQLILALLISWYTRFAQPKVPEIVLTDQQYSNPDPLLRVEQRRLVAAEQALLAPAAPLPLLSTPSHAPHWVAPTTLVQKLLTYQAAGQFPDTADLTLALARTAIGAEEDMAQALAMLPQLQHDGVRELLRQLLAPEATEGAAPVAAVNAPSKSMMKSIVTSFGRIISYKHQQPANATIPLEESLPWLRAVVARTRYPEAVLENLRPLSDYPGVAEPWQPSWHFEEKSHTYKQSWNKEKPEVTNVWQELSVATTHQGQVPPSPLLLYSLHARLSQSTNYYLWSLVADLPFLLTVLPNNPAPLHWHLVRTACRTDNMGSEARDLLLIFLRSLLVPGPRFEESTSLLLAVSLTHSAPTCRALALEVLLNAIAAGRLVPAALGEAMGRLLASGFAPVQRLADALAQTRAIDAATDDALRQLLAALLPQLPFEPLRNLRKLLEPYADLMARTRQAVPASVQERLRVWRAQASLKKTIDALLG